ncbi:LiaF transmembrane domain-containing protein [Mucilaginibacter sp. P25]|uniref:LiaF transmembrane domain-containing protein n=1 Tax=unclassified Mucilaginibacter TaxID=2617802 RepID=UPI003D6661F4
MNNDIEHPKDPNKGKSVAGIILLAVGSILLLQQFNLFFIPHNIVLWPFWLVFWGLYIGSKHQYKKASWLLLVGLGVLLLLSKNINNSDRILWPLAVIGFGMWLILRRNKHFDPQQWKNDFKGEKWANWDKKEPFQFEKAETVDYTVKEEGSEIPRLILTHKNNSNTTPNILAMIISILYPFLVGLTKPFFPNSSAVVIS